VPCPLTQSIQGPWNGGLQDWRGGVNQLSEQERGPVEALRACIDAAHSQACRALMDSLLHDVRNPLNALSINLDVVHEKVKRGGSGSLAQATQKNVLAMREQIRRVDGVLRSFADFLAPPDDPPTKVHFSEWVTRAIDLAVYEARRSQVRIRPLIEPGVYLADADGASARLMALLPVLRGVKRAVAGSEIAVTLSQTPRTLSLQVNDGQAESGEPLQDALGALQLLTARYRGDVRAASAECTVTLPRGPH
jgi:K+-sensing histidine kinase KdpD